LNCPKLKGKKGAKKLGMRNLIVEDIFGANDVLSVIVRDASPRDECVLDSRCSYRMCPNRDWLVTYQSIGVF